MAKQLEYRLEDGSSVVVEVSQGSSSGTVRSGTRGVGEKLEQAKETLEQALQGYIWIVKRFWLVSLVLMAMLSGCMPVVLGDTPNRPYNLDDFPTFTSPVGQNLFGERQYNRQRWEATSQPRAGITVEFSITFQVGGLPQQQAFDIQGIFGNPFDACSAQSTTRRNALGRLSVALNEAPAGWGVGLESAEYVLECSERIQQPDGARIQRFTTSLELLYRFTIPPTLGAGTYPVRWQVLDGSRVLASEDRRFVLSAR